MRPLSCVSFLLFIVFLLSFFGKFEALTRNLKRISKKLKREGVHRPVKGLIPPGSDNDAEEGHLDALDNADNARKEISTLSRIIDDDDNVSRRSKPISGTPRSQKSSSFWKDLYAEYFSLHSANNPLFRVPALYLIVFQRFYLPALFFFAYLYACWLHLRHPVTKYKPKLWITVYIPKIYQLLRYSAAGALSDLVYVSLESFLATHFSTPTPSSTTRCLSKGAEDAKR